MVNNTIARNRSNSSSTTASGAGIYAYSGASATGKNNIVYDNFATNSPNIYGSASFTYSCVEGGMSGTGNIGTDPLFVHNPPLGFFYISQIESGQPQNSPCVNAGDPTSAMIIGTTRTDLFPDVDIVDMGWHWWLIAWAPELITQLQQELCCELPQETVAAEDTKTGAGKLSVEITPNPFNPTTVLSYQLQDASLVKLTVYDISGRQIAELVNGWRDTGVYEVGFDGSGLPSGVYIYHLKTGDFTSSGKMVLVK
ncbi:hypothetical protein CEE37_12185 [candidate division LCP-89 bacterium B3_LCP]|uniref:Secretion system C-terminal sorting domain-containing protein n=1 Tax=candidate division LCP-89 bacterium B3_LCP TaxID=2012998 RepID=A0A532UUA0_UNCL8|nr:MAG: hypothetical protein CEE37_12185 [candidate division LCP-89 bacterium B3_LCP]